MPTLTNIYDKFFDGGITTIKTKEFASKKVCMNKAEEFCSEKIGNGNYKIIEDIPTKIEKKPEDKKGGKKIGKK